MVIKTALEMAAGCVCGDVPTIDAHLFVGAAGTPGRRIVHGPQAKRVPTREEVTGRLTYSSPKGLRHPIGVSHLIFFALLAVCLARLLSLRMHVNLSQ